MKYLCPCAKHGEMEEIMKKIFESPMLIKLQEAGQKLGANKYITALTTGLMSTMPLLMVGAVSQIICSVGTNLNLFTIDSAIYGYIYAPYKYTMEFLGLWVTIHIGYNYAKNLKMRSPLSNAIDVAIIYVMVCAPFVDGKLDTSFLSSTGMFVGFIVAFLVVRIEKFCVDKNLRIPMADVCPPALVDSFAAIIPLAINVILFQGINVLLSIVSGGALIIPSAIMAVLMIPLSGLTSLPGMFILCTITMLLWCFGIHGGGIVFPVIMASLFEAVQTNAALHAAGQPLVFYPVILYGAMAAVGGTGNTFALSILSLKAKSKQLKAIGKATVVPSLFNINEPVIFGMPIMYNPILCIPYILNTLVVMGFFAIGYSTGIITPVWTLILAILPMGVGSYLGSLNIMNAIWDYLMIIPSMLVWYPFFKIYDKQLLEKEESNAAIHVQEMV